MTKRRQKSRSDGVGFTRVGVWFLAFLGILALAATNTGNNGLYLVLATMFGVLAVSYFGAGLNVRGLEVTLEPPGEIFANQPAQMSLEIRNRSFLLPSWLLVLTIDPHDIVPAPSPPRRRSTPFLVPQLARRGHLEGQMEIMLRHRGRRRIRSVHLRSLFPVGLFSKGRRYPVAVDLLVYPELFAPSQSPPVQSAKRGEEPTRRSGWGCELLGLRDYRQGDDPRWIHWKHSARTGELVYQEHEVEENRQLLIVFDNATGALDESRARVFERLVSEAATAAVDYMDRGYEVSLLSREGQIPFACGRRQRLMILEALALIEARPTADTAIQIPTVEPHLLLAMDNPASPVREVAA
jgi:uncharacterized protein (DUF58 family)